MTFFPEVTPPDDDSSEHYVAPEWAAPPVDWLPSRIGVSTLLATTDDIAVTVSGLSVHASGLEIDVQWLLRNRHQNRRDWSTLMDRFGGGRWGNGAVDPARSIRFGVVLDDSTKVVADVGDAFHDDPAKAPTGPLLTLTELGGSGDDSYFTTSARLWLWPVPPDGRLELVLSWPEFDVSEARHTFDDHAYSVAARQARPIWSNEGN
ncbi:hypothetical protein [Frigoribacterium sp. CFBP 13707]|uniref:hypothetical protein n=1 Tax=Frigoribacterium sp. CFBP 13707 TaxID=2775313 RepID=UPI001781AC4B|nr:hypothetical protein [Frigoribacterium sp. CFBP 13707]MBD8729507.1 hypothetical protein [Frigoribacterium sp. CFBP 13707]